MEVFGFQAVIRRINYLGLSVYYFGTARLDRTWHGKQSALPVNRLYLPKSGEAIISVGEQTITMVPGFAYLVPAGAPMDFHCDDSMEKLYVHFNLFRPDRYDALHGLKEIYRIPFPQNQYEALVKHGKHGTIADTLVVKNIFYDLLAQFQVAYNLIDEHIPIYSRQVINTISYIQENLSAGLHLEDLAKHCYISRSTLTELFRKEVGISLGKYIDDQLIAAAQRQLSQTTYSIGEISNSLGYSNQCYFSRRFKQVCGMTPQLYRARNKIL